MSPVRTEPQRHTKWCRWRTKRMTQHRTSYEVVAIAAEGDDAARRGLPGTGRCPVVHGDHRAPVSCGLSDQRSWNAWFSASPPKVERTVTVPAAVGRRAVGAFLSRKS